MERQPFHVPDGYFESFTGGFMSRLPKRPVSSETKVISLYDRVKPWLYIAASFIGILILLNIFSKNEGVVMNDANSSPDAITSSESVIAEEDEDAEFMKYMEELYVDQAVLATILDDFWDN